MDELVIKMYSPSVINLTVVDLPGIVRVPIGDQSADIENQIKELLKLYIRNPNSIILAVGSANNDIATSESIKLTRSVDPNFDRTIVVITKLDLMDHGTDARDVLTGKWLDVKLGIVGVVNRSFEDLRNNKSISESIEEEAAFLGENYSEIASYHGTPYLRRRLQRIRMDYIKTCLPALQPRLTNLKTKVDSELKDLGGDFPLDMPAIMLKIIEKFSTAFRAAITGKSRDIEKRYLLGGAKLNFIFEDVLAEKVRGIDPCIDLHNSEILNCISSSTALESSVLFPKAAYQDLARDQIRRLVPAAMEVASLVNTEMLNIMQVCMKVLEQEMERFPHLKTAIQCEVNSLLNDRHHIAQDLLKTYVDVQASFIKTIQQPFNEENVTLLKKSVVSKIFAKFSRERSSGNQGQNQNGNGTGKHHQQQHNLNSNKSFFHKGSGNSSNSDNKSSGGPQSQIKRLYQPDKIEMLVKENGFIAEEWEKVTQMRKALETANTIVWEISDTDF